MLRNWPRLAAYPCSSAPCLPTSFWFSFSTPSAHPGRVNQSIVAPHPRFSRPDTATRATDSACKTKCMSLSDDPPSVIVSRCLTSRHPSVTRLILYSNPGQVLRDANPT